MHIIDNKLKLRERESDPIKVGLIGIGEMGKGLLNQINRFTPGMVVVGIYSRNPGSAEKACIATGIRKTAIASKPSDITDAFRDNSTAITDDIDLLLTSDSVDVAVELTGTISFALDAILKAFKHGKHVVSFNAELEATLGYYLKSEAEKFKVKYTLGDGDQPGVTLNLWRQVKLMGFEPLVCGNIKGMQDHYRNPSTQAAFAKQWGMNPYMATNFADGTKISFEQACIANATNMTVAQRGMIGPNSNKHVDELTDQFGDVEALRSMGGIVDYVVGGKPGPGVFVYAATNDSISKKYLSYGKLGDGPLYSFYVPYHLLFFELAFSIARLIDFDDVTLDAAYGLKVEVIAIAKKDLKAGEILDSIGGYMTYGVCEKSEVVKEEGLLPMGLAEGCILKKDVKKDSALKMNHMEYDSEQLKMVAYKQQLSL